MISCREIGRPEEDTQRLIGGFQPPPPAPMPPADPASSEALLTLLASVRQGMTGRRGRRAFAWPLDKARQALEQLVFPQGRYENAVAAIVSKIHNLSEVPGAACPRL